MTNTWAFIFLVLLSVSARGATVPVVTVAPGVEPFRMLKPHTEEFEKKMGAKLKILSDSGMGADSVFIAVDRGVAEVGYVGIAWDDWLSLLKEKKAEIHDAASIQHSEVAVRTVSFFTFRGTGAPRELSNDQLRGLLSGKTRNWKEIGGPDWPVIVVYAQTMPATQKQIREKLLKNEDHSPVTHLKDVNELVAYVGRTPGAIGWGPSNIDLRDANTPKHETFARPITMITRGPPSKYATELGRIIGAQK